jgi:Carbohydrate family 9 binding domain-like
MTGLAMHAQPHAQPPAPCEVSRPTASFSIPHIKSPGDLNTLPRSATWKKAKSAWIVKDCSRSLDYPDLKTEIKGFWSDTDLYLLFTCPYRTLNVFLPTQNLEPRRGLWDRDVVEIFLGDDWESIRHYREFEISPTADWIDLAIDLDRRGQNRDWRSGWKTTARIDERAKTWYAACRIPLKSVSGKEIKPGTRWRANLYRIDGDGPDPQRRFMCWQPTCVVNRDPNHVPENFGSLVFTK